MSGDALKHVFVVGISGTTNSGKTTIVKKLLEKYENCCAVGQDAFFMAPGDARLAPLYIPELNHHNWEDHRALEMDKMVATVKYRINQLQSRNDGKPAVLFVEGFSIFGWKPLLPFLDKKYFITLSHEVCESRRKERSYDPPDVPGYFEAVVWPEYVKHLESIKDQQDIVYVDGTNGLEGLYHLICSDIDTFFKTGS